MRKKSFKAESKRLLDLMINSIYTHKEIFLREIISNASDALDKLHYISLTDQLARENASELSVFITADKEARTITISDNGVGMNNEELENNLGIIANSGSFKFKQEIDEKQDAKNDIIGQFGVGFYSAYMIADQVTVITKRYDSDVAYKWNSTGADGYTIEESEKPSCGTDIIIHVKEDTETEKYSQYLEEYRIRSLVKKYSDYIRYPIKMETENTENTAEEGQEPKYEKVKSIETLNSMVPVWQRSKSEVSDEDCAAYYKEKFSDMSDPAAIIRVSAEGVVSYKAMLFIPGSVPYGYYTKEFEKGLQLYSSGVLIMDKCGELLPDYFRFVKGVVDSQDLSLNISREVLQHDHQLKVIATNIEKKIKSELTKLLNNDFDNYLKFWKNFGTQLKYGVVSDYGMHKDVLQDFLVFYSSDQENLVTLKSYIERMKDGQKYIYYACGESTTKISALPQTEVCREKGYEMLYLTDDVDEFVIQSLQKYEDIEFRSVSAEDAELGSDEDKEKIEKQREENKDLLEFVKETLKDNIESAVVSDKLKTHPVFISTQGPITIEMEKYFSSIPGETEKPKASKVLELNAEHKTFESLKSAYETDKDKAAKYVKILYNQACLIAGLPIDNPVEYCDMVCTLMD
ncbi:MAG: molecular chaperone HtpG [Oscillospiraceae bacterium]|nr:molecular chaperone HtpG [Oscillospiraceae bacterium]